MLLYFILVGLELRGNRIYTDTQNRFFKLQVRPFRVASVAKEQSMLLIHIKSIQVGEVFVMWLFTERTVLQSENVGSCGSVFDLILVEELLYGDLGSEKFGLVDEIAE